LMRRVGDNSVASSSVEQLMRRALEATRTTYPHPNPRVGAVLSTPDGVVLATAAHQARGGPHAEVLALDEAHNTVGTTLFVTLEPCNHHGETPPCTDAIINAGVARVIIGARDPDERVSGSGIERLMSADIEVSVGVLSNDVVANDPGYFHHRTTGYPRLTLKLATTLDGQVAAADGTSKWITSPESRADAHRLRASNDAVIVGAGTVIADDPALDVRLTDFAGRQPTPVVIAGEREIPTDRQIMRRDPIIYRPDGAPRVDPVAVLRDLGERGFVSAMIEGGPAIASAFLEAGLVDEIVWYTASKLAGGRGIPAFGGVFATMADITDLDVVDVQRVGSDIRITATITRER
jgi:diaminohydroxyphosphoribosylaminopyrimidine deaminase/5-amino-6-(5-phosphoribosylamino)uracil reductase